MKIIDEQQHGLRRDFVHANAVKVLDALVTAGFEAYLVGGAVRDALLGMQPKDFDVATNARPEQVKKVLRNSLIIGRRFKLVHVRFGRDIIEVATFRSLQNNEEDTQTDTQPDTAKEADHLVSDTGQIMRDNVYGTLEEDASRRDFAMNAMYYDWHQNRILDYHQGYADIQQKTIRLIGEPALRYQEDPVRMLRAIRFMGKLGFGLDAATEAPIQTMADQLLHIPVARLFEEYLKLFHAGQALQTFRLLRSYHLFHFLFPQTSAHLPDNQQLLAMVETALADTDARVNSGTHVNPGYLIAVFLWQDFNDWQTKKLCKDLPALLCAHKATSKVLQIQRKSTSIPKRVVALVQEVWSLQLRMQRIRGKQPFRTLEQAKYRAGYDFLSLRYRAGETALSDLLDWWTRFQDAGVKEKQSLAKLHKPKAK